jgi:tRNA-dihydrouridine synthase
MSDLDIGKRLTTLLKHLQLYEAAWGNSRPFPILKRFFKIYVSGFGGAAELRKELMETNSFEEVRRAVEGTRFRGHGTGSMGRRV